jgi:hypothetical protein
MKYWWGCVLAVGFMLGWVSPASAADYIIYVHGRGWGSWNGEVAAVSGWTNVTLSYDGNSRLDGPATNTTVRNAISTYCTGSHRCVIECYSAGCLRTLKAVADLRNAGNTLPGLMWGLALSSAAGGSALAETSTQGGTSMVAKLFGQQEKIDFDITRSAARNTFGYVQGNFGKQLYHTMGKIDICKKIIFFKACGNPNIGEGVGDGAVGMASGGGYSSTGVFSSGCPGGSASSTTGKYAWRQWEAKSPCDGEPYDHFGMPALGRTILNSYSGVMVTRGWTGDNVNPANTSWSDNVGTRAECRRSTTECDNMFVGSSENNYYPADYSKRTDLTAVATDVSTKASDTTYPTGGNTCKGKCGGTAYWTDSNGVARSCRCDTGCTSRGDCCSDYANTGTSSTSSNCTVALAQ